MEDTTSTPRQHILVASRRHHLIPLAWRLQRSGIPTQIAVWKGRYRKCWEGHPSLSRAPAELEGDGISLVAEGSPIIVTDQAKIPPEWREGDRLIYATPVVSAKQPASPLTLAAWWDGSRMQLHHLVVADIGVGMGNQGSAVWSACTLYALNEEQCERLCPGALEKLQSACKSMGHLGLCGVDLIGDDSGKMQVVGMQFGWSPLHTAAFAGLVDISALLLREDHGGMSEPCGAAVTVSVPPWPIECNASSGDRDVIFPVDTSSHCWFYDVRFDVGDDGIRITTAGTDGLVATAHAGGPTPEVAMARAIQRAETIQVSERQLRFDAGQQVRPVLTTLQMRGML